MSGFTVKCNDCGKVHEVKTAIDIPSVAKSVGYDGEIGIHCECGNKVEQGDTEFEERVIEWTRTAKTFEPNRTEKQVISAKIE